MGFFIGQGILHCRIDGYITAWTKNVDLQPLCTKLIKQELIAVFIQALHRNEYDFSCMFVLLTYVYRENLTNGMSFPTFCFWFYTLFVTHFADHWCTSIPLACCICIFVVWLCHSLICSSICFYFHVFKLLFQPTIVDIFGWSVVSHGSLLWPVYIRTRGWLFCIDSIMNMYSWSMYIIYCWITIFLNFIHCALWCLVFF